MPKFIVESDIDVHTFSKRFHERSVIAECATLDEAYAYIKQYVDDTVQVYHHFARHTLCNRDEVDELVGSDPPVAITIVLGNFEDTIYIKKA